MACGASRSSSCGMNGSSRCRTMRSNELSSGLSASTHAPLAPPLSRVSRVDRSNSPFFLLASWQRRQRASRTAVAQGHDDRGGRIIFVVGAHDFIGPCETGDPGSGGAGRQDFPNSRSRGLMFDPTSHEWHTCGRETPSRDVETYCSRWHAQRPQKGKSRDPRRAQNAPLRPGRRLSAIPEAPQQQDCRRQAIGGRHA